MIIPANVHHRALDPMAIGLKARVKINANIGNSPTTSSLDEEFAKLGWRLDIKSPAPGAAPERRCDAGAHRGPDPAVRAHWASLERSRPRLAADERQVRPSCERAGALCLASLRSSAPTRIAAARVRRWQAFSIEIEDLTLIRSRRAGVTACR